MSEKRCKCGRPSLVETGECDRCAMRVATQQPDYPVPPHGSPDDWEYEAPEDTSTVPPKPGAP